MNEKLDILIKHLSERTNLTFKVSEITSIIYHLESMKEKPEAKEEVISKKKK